MLIFQKSVNHKISELRLILKYMWLLHLTWSPLARAAATQLTEDKWEMRHVACL